ncbi:EAL domain-containing protein [Lacticaseibacillus hulanensis]|uniref:EAL domain-containing protein n=1 Tax=Lacticaseibacillus hulanensis TaxID=2493111 RepID=UPI000FDB06FD|nr:EAL domain-containing protein [Lacticaseibacillus hulanensis]
MARYSYFAQPIENISTGRIILYELLLREWNNDQKRWQVPTNFAIPASTMVDLLEQSVAELNGPHVSINLTKDQFADAKFARAITNFVSQNMVPRQLTVELVDTPDLTVLKKMSAAYRAAGVLLAIDDVGSDNMYSEVKDMLPYVNTIKFALQNMRARGCATTKREIEALHFWFEQAEEQQMLFTFEGIETKEDIELATHFGISRGQGYFFSRPLSPEMFTKGSIHAAS